MKQVLIICLAMLLLMSFAGCAAPAYDEPTEATTEPETTEETLSPFEEYRVLAYYLNNNPRYGVAEVLEGTQIHLWVYDLPCYRGDDVRNLAPGDLLILGNREILIETIEIDKDLFSEETFVINGGEGVDGIWLRPFTFYNLETKRTEIDYTPCNSASWDHLILTEEMDVELTRTMGLKNPMRGDENMIPEDFVEDLKDYPYRTYPYNAMFDMANGELNGIYLLSRIASQTNLSMIPKGLKPIDPDRLNSLMTGE